VRVRVRVHTWLLRACRRGRRWQRGISAAEAGAFGPEGPRPAVAVMMRLQVCMCWCARSCGVVCVHTCICDMYALYCAFMRALGAGDGGSVGCVARAIVCLHACAHGQRACAHGLHALCSPPIVPHVCLHLDAHDASTPSAAHPSTCTHIPHVCVRADHQAACHWRAAGSDAGPRRCGPVRQELRVRAVQLHGAARAREHAAHGPGLAGASPWVGVRVRVQA